MPSIGSISCLYVHPVDVQDLAQSGEVWTVPGVSGIGSRRLGLNDSNFVFEAVAIGTPNVIESWYASLRGCKFVGVGAIVDDWNRTYPYCEVTQVKCFPPQARVNHDALGTCIGRAYVVGVFLPA